MHPAMAAGRRSSPPGFEYIPCFLAAARSDRLLERLWSGLAWRQDSIRLFGRRLPQPRLTAWLGDNGARYRYSGLMLEPAPWHPELADLSEELERNLCCRFNSVLVNAYRDGRDSMGWHADDEPELGKEPVIAAVSLGACRRFLVRPVAGGGRTEFRLEHGSLLVMSGPSQLTYRHAVPKTVRPTGLRISLTFRNILAQA